MSAPPRREGAVRPPGDDPPDEGFARTYAAGYEEGVRSALREVLGHASRGHTTAELRMLIESRLARLSEEVELKRRSLLAPPRQPAWAALLRPPTPVRPWGGPSATEAPAPPPAPLHLGAGTSCLVKEERPVRAVEALRENAKRFPRVVLVSLHPPDLPEVPPDQRIVIAVAGGGEGPNAAPMAPGEMGGRLREQTQAPGGALIYIDALEFLATEHSFELTLRFVHWLVNQVGESGSALLVSFDPRVLDVKDMSRLERAFQSVL